MNGFALRLLIATVVQWQYVIRQPRLTDRDVGLPSITFGGISIVVVHILPKPRYKLTSERSTMAVCDLPKVETWVRFPSLAPLAIKFVTGQG